MHEAKDSRLQKKRMNSPWRQCNWITVVIQRATDVGLPTVFLFKGGFGPSSPTLFLNLNMKAPLANTKTWSLTAPCAYEWIKPVLFFLVLPCYYASSPVCFCRSDGASLIPPQEWNLLQLKRLGALSVKRAYLFHLLSCKIFFKATSPRSTQSNPKAFPWKSSFLPKDKTNSQTEGTFLLLRGEHVQSSVYTQLHTHQILTTVGGVFIQT